MKILPILLITLAAAGALAAETTASENEIATEFAVLVGFPTSETGAVGGVVLVPGTVIPLTGDTSTDLPRDTVERSLSFTRTVEKLWMTFRLDPLRRSQQGRVVMTQVASAVALPAPDGAGIEIEATLVSCTHADASYRVVFRQADEIIADTTVAVPRGGRSVVGGMDGEAAPYLFVFIQPDPPHGATTKWQEGIGLSQPVAIEKVNPRYPVAALKAGASGVVVLEAIIGSDGQVVDARILESPDPSLGEAAAAAVRKWRFEPARDPQGTPLKVSMVLTLTFHLK